MIPKLIHQLWIGGPPPNQIAGWMESWLFHHPEWEYRFWGEETRDWLTHTQWLWDEMGEYIAPEQIPQARSDLFRMEVLYRLGGVYADADFEALKPLDPLIEGVECFTAWEVDGKWANMAIAGAVPGHPFLKRLLDNVAEHMDAHRFEGPSSTYITGPRFISQHLGPDVTVFPSSMFYPYSYRQINRRPSYGDAYAVHHWQNQRTRKARR
jgi:inositol phosphorylceramide mannosyltransferase catalytic subunit